MYGKKLKIGNIMNSVNSCTEMNFQKRVVIVLDILCESKGLKFEKVEPSNGDAKNDGWILDKNIYFAMYSPNDANLSQNNQIVRKLSNDLDGLCDQVFNKKKWGKDIKEFYLIVNTHDKDLPADPERLKEKKIKEIKDKYNKDFTVKVITTNEIKKYLLEQDDEIIDKISNNLDIETITTNFSIPDVMEFMDDYFIYLSSTNIEQKDMDNIRINTLRKIEINQLTSIKDRILGLVLDSNKIEQYISFLLEDGINIEKYNKLKNYIIEEYIKLEDRYIGEELYCRLLDNLIYDNMSSSHIYILEAVVVNIFIRCDIFKKEIED